MTIKCEDGTYEYVKATVNEDGIHLRYKATELEIAGRDFIDDHSANVWSNGDIQDVVASILGITEGKNEIEVIHD